MNAIQFGEVISAPDGDGFLTVAFSDATRRVWAQPERFAEPWPIPAPGDRAAVAPGLPDWHLLWCVGQGTPSYSFGGD